MNDTQKSANGAYVTDTILDERPAPKNLTGPIAWLRENLFNGASNIVLTLAALVIVYLVLPGAVSWAITNANWVGGADACRANIDGACWPFITRRWEQYLYGFYEHSERWRVNVLLGMLAVGIGLLVYEKTPKRNWIGMFMLLVYPVIAFVMLYGSETLGLQIVSTDQWGGFMLTLVVALTGIVASLPLGIVLALGRRSSMPVIRNICVVFIEFWRGVPLITVLFMASVMFPLFLPDGVTVNQLLRAVVGVALFSSAYMAEVVRGGLQAIPTGQVEGASSLGLGYWQSMRLVVMPQALKIVIPGIVSTFIGLFKDTTLVMIIGLLDLFGSVQAAVADPNWAIKSVPYTGYAFCAIVFWIFCYSMSRYSRYLEDKLHTGHKR